MRNPPAILVIEDEMLIRWTLRNCFQRLGFCVVEAESGEAGVALLDQGQFSAVVLDLRLPGMDGMEVLERLRKKHPTCRVWMMSAHGTPEILAQARALGVDEFLAKPFDCGDLADRVLAALAV